MTRTRLRALPLLALTTLLVGCEQDTILGFAIGDLLSPDLEERLNSPGVSSSREDKLKGQEDKRLAQRSHINGRWGGVAVPVSPDNSAADSTGWVLMVFVNIENQWKLMLGCSESALQDYELGDLWQTLSDQLDPADANSLREIREWFKDFESTQQAKRKKE